MDREAMDTKQIQILHLSDLHFGKYHRFRPPSSTAGDIPKEEDYPSLIDKLIDDLKDDALNCPTIVCITGDITQTSDVKEFSEAENFIQNLVSKKVWGNVVDIKNVFVVPGNHDTKYDESDINLRWQQWVDFYNRVFNTNYRRENPLEMVEVQDRIEDLGIVLINLNSCLYIEKNSPDEERGRFDIKILTKVETQLEDLKNNNIDRFNSSIRIAIVHHHPILIPSLVEPDKGYDAIHNSGKLLTILKRYGFHVILHGHKHDPHTFTENALQAFQNIPERPIFVAAGGSLSSTSLPYGNKVMNCYNRILVKWDSTGQQTRIRVETRGLNLYNEDYTEKLPTMWNWVTLRIDDKHFFTSQHVPCMKNVRERYYNSDSDDSHEKQRIHQYQYTRGNFPVVKVMPSLIPNQAYEAVLWIVHHPFDGEKKSTSYPVEVVWSAGKKFEIVSVKREADDLFCARLSFYGSMLVQANLKFSDKYEATTYVYCHLPEDYS